MRPCSRWAPHRLRASAFATRRFLSVIRCCCTVRPNHQCPDLHLFCLLLPFGFTDLLGWATPFTSTLIAYTFFGLDALSDELEDPFGTGLNALPINALATTIEINLREAIGDTDLPADPRPVDYVLM